MLCRVRKRAEDRKTESTAEKLLAVVVMAVGVRAVMEQVDEAKGNVKAKDGAGSNLP